MRRFHSPPLLSQVGTAPSRKLRFGELRHDEMLLDEGPVVRRVAGTPILSPTNLTLRIDFETVHQRIGFGKWVRDTPAGRTDRDT